MKNKISFDNPKRLLLGKVYHNGKGDFRKVLTIQNARSGNPSEVKYLTVDIRHIPYSAKGKYTAYDKFIKWAKGGMHIKDDT